LSILGGGEEFHSSEQNARLIAGKLFQAMTEGRSNRLIDADEYYKAMYFSSAGSWNLHNSHIFETLKRVLDHKGQGAKAII
jgi:erythromycin esterase-like protein